MRENDKPDPCEEKSFVPRFQEKKINVFVSSTFRDMIAERDELTLRVFPGLRKICEERGIAWGEVDLRWGIPEEKSKTGETLAICLEYIEKCRPYFIGMLGERYGWVDPDGPESVKDDHPWIKEQADKSITELEILHGVLRNPEMATHAYFYFRDPAYLESGKFKAAVQEQDRADYRAESPEVAGKLADLKERIRKSGFPVRDNYPDPVAFGALVREDLMQVIDALAPAPQPLTDAERASAALDREEMAHEAFAASRFGVYIPRQAYFDRLDNHAQGDTPPLVVLGESGSGKSALLAHWAFRYRLRHPDDLVLVHFVGASSESTDWASMLRRFMGEFKRKFYLTEEIPAQDDALLPAFRNWLSMAAAHGRVVLVIDALNQLEDRNGAPDLVWLPPMVPENIRLIASTLPGRPLDAVRKRGWPEITVEPLTVLERDALITCYFRKFHKQLDPPVQEALASAPQGQNPLFLRALLEEVRIHGVFERLADQINEYLAAQTVDALYEMILTRYERDYERDRLGLVKDTASLIWAARWGLAKPELMDLLGTDGKPLPDAYWAPLYLAMEHSLVEKDGRITFFHDYLRTAVVHRYIATVELKRASHLLVADYFAGQPDGMRKIEELPWQLAEAAEWDRLVALLTYESFFLKLYEYRKFDLMQYWVKTETASAWRMAEAYRPVLDRPGDRSKFFLNNLGLLLKDTGHPAEAGKLFKALSSKSQDEPYFLSLSLCNLALILHTRGDLDGAMRLLKEQVQICRDLGNVNDLQIGLGNQARVLYARGDLDGAMALLKEQERICRELGNINSLQGSFGNQANVLYARGDLDGAMKLYKEQELICREHGNVNDLQISLGNQANILYDRRDFDEAMKLLKEKERICRELGNVDSLQASLGNQAMILKNRGNLDGAMTLLKEKERICRELRNINELQISLGNQALILTDRGNLDGAMTLLKEQERICRELGNVAGLQISLGNQANILYDRRDFDETMKLLKEKEGICRKLGDLNSLQWTLGKQALILMASGNLDRAMNLLKEAEWICRKRENVDGLAMSLINQALILSQQNRPREALAAADEAYRLASGHGYSALAKQILPILEKIRREK